MSPRPVVVAVVMVKYAASILLSGGVNDPGHIVDITR
jgi:hypothetical protein